jgi:hypothetical protein
MNIIREPNFENLGKVVALFFVADGKLLFHGCSIDEVPVSSRFITYPEGHQEVWEREHREQYNVAYDYYPRGRILYDKKADILMLFTDPCVIDVAEKLAEAYKDGFRWVFTDEQYHCHMCNSYHQV